MFKRKKEELLKRVEILEREVHLLAKCIKKVDYNAKGVLSCGRGINNLHARAIVIEKNLSRAIGEIGSFRRELYANQIETAGVSRVLRKLMDILGYDVREKKDANTTFEVFKKKK